MPIPEDSGLGRELSQSPGNDIVRQKRVNALVGIGVGALFHPLQHAKVLIQLGHEPLPLLRGRQWWLFGKDTYYLPNGLQIAKHIYRNDGLSGLYRGVTSCVCGNLIGYFATVTAKEYIDEVYPDANVNSLSPFKKLLHKTAKESVAKCAGVVAARPFQVIMIRAIAQSIGGETHYTGVYLGLSQSNKDGGIRGLFAGLVPQLLGDLCIMWTSTMILHGIDRIWQTMIEPQSEQEQEEEDELDDDVDAMRPPKTIKKMMNFVVPYFVNSFFYPLQLVATVMAANGCGLAAGMEPHIPVFLSWTDCYNYLQSRNQARRGSKLFFRFYNGPMCWRMGQTFASVKHLEI